MHKLIYCVKTKQCFLNHYLYCIKLFKRFDFFCSYKQFEKKSGFLDLQGEGPLPEVNAVWEAMARKSLETPDIENIQVWKLD